jgi:hypothetical protein
MYQSAELELNDHVGLIIPTQLRDTSQIPRNSHFLLFLKLGRKKAGVR